MKTDEKKAFVRSYLEALNTADLEIIRSFYDEGSTLEDPYGTAPKVGVDDICAFYEQALSNRITARSTGPVCCAGDSVAFPYHVSLGKMQIDLITVFQFADNDKVKSMKAYWGQAD